MESVHPTLFYWRPESTAGGKGALETKQKMSPRESKGIFFPQFKIIPVSRSIKLSWWTSLVCSIVSILHTWTCSCKIYPLLCNLSLKHTKYTFPINRNLNPLPFDWLSAIDKKQISLIKILKSQTDVKRWQPCWFSHARVFTITKAARIPACISQNSHAAFCHHCRYLNFLLRDFSLAEVNKPATGHFEHDETEHSTEIKFVYQNARSNAA